MTAGGTPGRPVAELRPGDTVDDAYLLGRLEIKTTRKGSLYLAFVLQDRSGTIPGRRWDATRDMHDALRDADVVQVRGRVEEYRGDPQVIADAIRPAPPGSYSPRDFLPATDHDRGELVRSLREILATIRNPHLADLVDSFLEDEEFMEAFAEAPAAMMHHHAYLGGLLEHVVSLLRVVTRLAEAYPRADRDLLLVGAFLHDVGKVRELTWDTAIDYSDEGKLIGHIVMGAEIVRERARALPDFPPRLLDLVVHLILSHHGEYEFGAPRLPLIPEAILLHHADHVDAKLWSYWNAADEAGDDASWTSWVKSFGRSLYCGPDDQPAPPGGGPAPGVD